MSVTPASEPKLQSSRSAAASSFHTTSNDDTRAASLFVRLFHAEKVTSVPPKRVSALTWSSQQYSKDLRSGAIQVPTSLTFYLAFGPLGIPLLIVAIVCIVWTSWLIVLTVAPNEAANMLMHTGDYDNGAFWLIVEREPVVKWASVAGLLLVTASYLLVLIRMICFRRTVLTVCKSNDKLVILRTWSALSGWWRVQRAAETKRQLQRLHRSYSNLTGFNAVNRKYFNTVLKAWDLVVQGLVLRRSLNQGLPEVLVYGYAVFITVNSLSVASNILTRRNSAFAEVIIDSAFDFAAAVLYPMAVLLYCYYNFSFDRDVYIVNAEILPDGNFERFARMLADPAEVALFLINFNSLRMSGALDFALGVGMNLSFCYRFFRVLTAIQQRCHDPNQIIPTPKKVRGRAQRQRSVPRWMALIFLAASVFTFVYTYKSVTSSHAKCSSYPECVAYAHVWDSGGHCPCIIMVDGDRAPLSAHEWNFPEDVTEKVRALASAGMLNGLQLVNRELLYWPEELRQCTEMKTISLIYTSTKEIPAWAKEFKQLQHLHIEGKYGSENLVKLPSDLFSDLPEFTFMHIGNHHNLVSIPPFGGTSNLRSMVLAVLFSLTELPPLNNLPNLETLTLVHMPLVPVVPDMAKLTSLSRFVVFRPNHLCCNGFIGACNLTDSFCQPEPVFSIPGAVCLKENDPRHATAATQEVFARFAPAICQKPPIPFALEAMSDFPSPERIASCDGVMYRKCEIPGVTTTNGIVGMCYSSRMQVVACNVDQLFIEVRRVQIQRQVGAPCDLVEEAWLGCK